MKSRLIYFKCLRLSKITDSRLWRCIVDKQQKLVIFESSFERMKNGGKSTVIRLLKKNPSKHRGKLFCFSMSKWMPEYNYNIKNFRCFSNRIRFLNNLQLRNLCSNFQANEAGKRIQVFSLTRLKDIKRRSQNCKF